MIGTIRKHSQWMWAIIITVVIISFVVFFTPDAKLGRDSRRADFGTLNGRPVSRAEIQEAAREARLAFYFRTRRWPQSDDIEGRFSGFNLDREARTHLLLAEELKLNKVEVNDALVAAHIRNSFRDRDGKFDPQNYFVFLRQELNPQGISQEDFERFLRHEIGRMHLGSVYGLSGALMPARAAEAFFRRENEQVATEAVFFQDTNFVNAVVIETNALRQFFTNQLASYKVRERVQVGYVAFAHSNYLAAADAKLNADTNLSVRLEAELAARGTNALRDDDGKPLAADAARRKIREEFRAALARTNAVAAATEFANELYKLQPASAANLQKLAAAKNLPVLDSGPFDDLDGPVSFKAPRLFTRVAFSLTDDAPLSPTVAGDDAVYLLAFKRRLPSENPSFDSVKDKVIADYRRAQSHEACMQAARAALVKITNSLAAGKSFKDAAAAEKLTVVEVPVLTRRLRQMAQLDERGVELDRYREVAFSLGKGRVSQPDTTFSGAYFFYVKDVVPVPEERLRAELPAFADELRENRMNYAFGDWFNREAERSGFFTGRPAQGEGRPSAAE